MSSEVERRTAIIVAFRCGRAPKEIIDFFKFPKATVYSIAKSFKETLSLPARWSSRPHVQFGAKLVLRESRHVLVKGVLAPSSPDLNPCDYYLWGVLERDTNKRAHNTVDSLKAAIIQAVANLSREQVAHAVGRFRHRVEAVIVKGGSWIE
ncbi:Transposable element tcb1 transposase [Caligus rogercresseyi]|uniref:Transposable element tcb1 transposase n=1 Tax=Caligus rogercresseyi TaxID=217165 RepID=A0A7T8H2B7_CALRO|nr:Transposable element tcb1 transposase [Caligus rogercresseyi]